VSKENTNTSNLMDDLVKELGADLEFYQCFKLTEEEFNIIKEHNNQYISNELNLNEAEIKEQFIQLLESVPCEKFIAIGHFIEYFFCQSLKDAEISMNYIVKLLDYKTIELDDLKHG
jgi:hypothetical protein